jgi:hypothetical protein
MPLTKDIPPKSPAMEKPVKASGPARSRGAGSGAHGLAGNNARKQDWIGRQLQRAFEDVAREPVPDDILNLLDQLGSTEAPPGDKPNADKGSDKP